MIELRAGHMRLRIHPLALLRPPLALALGLRDAAPALLVSLICHEAGHLAAARLARVRMDALTVMPFGCALQLGNLYALSPGQVLAVSAGGPMFSLLLLFADGALAHWGVLSPALALDLLRVTLMLLLFNLLPALPLDGGRMLYALTVRRLGRDGAARLGAVMGYVVAGCLMAATVCLSLRARRFNLTLPLCAAFILKGVAEDRAALSEALPASLLGALRARDAPVPVRLYAVREDCPAIRALRSAAPDSAALYAVYRGEALAALVDERALLRLAIDRPGACVSEAINNRPRVA
ncbi:MAG: hypothetical protein IJH86_03865 [Clostridia bacterium]|nr:hypothetical protein [Clostridia bacterium]